MTVFIKEWFFKKMQQEQHSSHIHLTYGACEIMKETEKAYLLQVEYVTLNGENDGWKNLWCPKKCTMTTEEYALYKIEEQKRDEQMQKNFDEGCKKYEALVKFAKENKVKGVRVGMRTETILKKSLKLDL